MIQDTNFFNYEDSINKLLFTQKTLLKSIQPFTTKDLADFIDSCKKYFGDYRFTQKLNAKVEYLGERYDNYGQLALGFAKILGVFFMTR